jgi:hypothetical protein
MTTLTIDTPTELVSMPIGNVRLPHVKQHYQTIAIRVLDNRTTEMTVEVDAEDDVAAAIAAEPLYTVL